MPSAEFIERKSDKFVGKSALLRAVIAIIIATLASLVWQLSGSGQYFDRESRISRELMFETPATGKIAVVEIDARSLADIGKWPWPRSLHGKIVDRLNEAGADVVAFDVDFSSQSIAAEDTAFAKSLRSFDGTVILPAFRQQAASSGSETIDSEPIAELRDQAILASVNIFPDPDGVMRRYSSGGETTGTPRPSMPAMLANAAGATDEEYWISNSITPASLPRFSAADIINGRFNSAALKGKTVLIGATAIEMGDRYPTAAHGVQPGVIIQAIAAETLLQQLAFPDYGAVPLILFSLLLCICLVGARTHIVRSGIALLGFAALVILPMATEQLKLATLGSTGGMIMLGVAYLSLMIQDRIAAVRARQLIDADTGLPNMRALTSDLPFASDSYLFMMYLNNLGELVSLLGTLEKAKLYLAIERRITGVSQVERVYVTDNGALAWIAAFNCVEAACDHASAVCALLVSPVYPGDYAMIARPSVGIGAVGEDVIQKASLAAEIAASRGQKWLPYDQSMSEESGQAQIILSGIDDAIQNGEIQFLFQPKYSFAKKRFCGAEALVRWTHPQLGPISPDEFIPILETSGRLEALTLHSLAVVEPILWQWQVEGGAFHLAVNISAPLLSNPHFGTLLEERLERMGQARTLLKLEITESANLGDDIIGIALLKKIRSMGCKISIDDYGTGNSTLAYLQKFPADEIKIDKSFVTNISKDESDRKLVRSTIVLAHDLGLAVVAEGVEDLACATLLAELGCDMGQGWHFSKPLTREDLETLIGGEPRRVGLRTYG